MSRKIHQYIVTETNKNIIADTSPVIQLGIQALPGTTFCVNGGNEIQIGQYGLYELDLSDLGGQILDLTFVKIVTNSTHNINSALVDIVYEN